MSVQIVKLEGVPVHGLGSISLIDRLDEDSDPLSIELVDEAVRQIAAKDFSVELAGASIRMCGDGRFSEQPLEGAQLFGATPGFVKSLRISGNIEEGGSAGADVENFTEMATGLSIEIGAHRADTHGGPGCGCGECDAAEISAEIATDTMIEEVAELMRAVYGLLDLEQRYDISAIELETLIEETRESYRQLHEAGYFAGGSGLVSAVDRAQSGNQTVELLEGGHKEVAWVINLDEDAVFDREAFAAEWSGQGVQVFWEDQWAVELQAKKYGLSGDDMKRFIVADLMRRLATALALTKADLVLVVIK